MRRQVFHSNQALVAQGNQQGLNYTLGLNRFADWTQVSAPQNYLAACCCMQGNCSETGRQLHMNGSTTHFSAWLVVTHLCLTVSLRRA